MKRLLSLLLTVILTFSVFVSCGNENPPAGKDTSGQATEPATDPAPGTTENVPDTGETDVDAESVTPLLWKATDAAGHELYLFGTIHAGDGRTGIAVGKLTDLISGCGALAVEFDVVAYEKDFAKAMQDARKFVLKDGKKITDCLPAELYEKAKAVLTEAKMYNPMLDLYNLTMWNQLVEQALLTTKSSLSIANAVDTQLIELAYKKDIKVLEVESYDYQSDLLLGFSDELNVFLIKEALDNADKYGEELDGLFAAWVAGDEEAIIGSEIGEDEYTDEELALIEEYNSKLIYERNIGMADKAEEYLASGQKTFFAVGCAHMVGEGGVVDLLTQRGYTVERGPVA